MVTNLGFVFGIKENLGGKKTCRENQKEKNENLFFSLCLVEQFTKGKKKSIILQYYGFGITLREWGESGKKMYCFL